jgi:hypothetical protein
MLNERHYRQREPRFLSRPFKVIWAGWETTTHKLQQCGWMIAAEQHDMAGGRFRLLMKHEQMQLVALSTFSEFDLHTAQRAQFFEEGRFPAFQVTHVVNDIQFRIAEMGMPNFKQIDAEPQITYDQIKSVDDLNIFKIPLERAEEIIIDKADMTVVQHLKAIKELQKDKQAEIRESRRKRDAREARDISKPEHEVVANIIHFPGAA